MDMATKLPWFVLSAVIDKNLGLSARFCVIDTILFIYRLIKGDGEVVEECVSYSRHKEINKVSISLFSSFISKKFNAVSGYRVFLVPCQLFSQVVHGWAVRILFFRTNPFVKILFSSLFDAMSFSIESLHGFLSLLLSCLPSKSNFAICFSTALHHLSLFGKPPRSYLPHFSHVFFTLCLLYDLHLLFE